MKPLGFKFWFRRLILAGTRLATVSAAFVFRRETAESISINRITIKDRSLLWYGVLRRLFLLVFNRTYFESSVSKRKGKCLRCGACCRLIFRQCIYLKIENDGKYSCRAYKSFRPPNCKIFPIDCRDIKDRNIVSHKPCGYHFD